MANEPVKDRLERIISQWDYYQQHGWNVENTLEVLGSAIGEIKRLRTEVETLHSELMKVQEGAHE